MLKCIFVCHLAFEEGRKRVRKSERRRKREEIEESMRENERNCTFSSGPQRPIGQVGPWPYQYLSTPKFKIHSSLPPIILVCAFVFAYIIANMTSSWHLVKL